MDEQTEAQQIKKKLLDGVRVQFRIRGFKACANIQLLLYHILWALYRQKMSHQKTWKLKGSNFVSVQWKSVCYETLVHA